MSDILTGKVAVKNIDGTIAFTGTGLLGTTEMINKSATLKTGTQTVDLVKNGITVTRAYTNRTRMIDITVAPYDPASPGNLATHKAKLIMPAEGSIVTLAGWASPDFNGDWNFESGGWDPEDNGFLKGTMHLTRVGDNAGVPAALAVQS